MKNNVATTLAIALSLAAVTMRRAGAESYTEAQFTRVDNEVRILKENAQPQSATIGAQIKAITTVSTGGNSRAELRFPDRSLTRLGSNTRFTLRGEARTLDLIEGVMMLQVPKKMGGAKVRTAAVTAAVTGTTVMIEYRPDGYVKLIVIEGEVDLYNNNKPSDVRTAHAGEMILMKPDGKTPVPEPVDIDLKKLLQSSKLLSADDEGPNSKQINTALQGQQREIKNGELGQTGLVIPGRGNIIRLTDDARLNLFQNFDIRPGPNQSGPGNPGPAGGLPAGGPIGTNGAPLVAQIAPIRGKTIITGGSIIYTDPTVEAYNTGAGAVIKSDGKIYNGQRDGLISAYTFGNVKSVSPYLQPLINSRGDTAVFRFEGLDIQGTPTIYTSDGLSNPPLVIPHLILASDLDITLYNPAVGPQTNTVPRFAVPPPVINTTELNLSAAQGLQSLTLYADTGLVDVQSSFVITGYNQDLTLVAADASGDVQINGAVNLSGSGDLFATSGRDLSFGRTTVTADTVYGSAGNNLNINGTQISATKKATYSARGNISVTSSAQLKVLATDPTALLRLEALQGNITLADSVLTSGNNIEIEASAGNIDLNNVTLTSGKNVEIAAQQGNVTLTKLNVTSSDVFKAGALGPNGLLTINGGVINANSIIRLYGEGANGVLFTGNVTLNANSGEVQIAGNKVRVDAGGNVTINGSGHIFANIHDYELNAPGTASHGSVNGSQVIQHQGTAGKPDFKTGGRVNSIVP